MDVVAGQAGAFWGIEHGHFREDTLTTTLVTTLVWTVVTLGTAPEPHTILLAFYRKVRPQVTG